MDIYLSLFKITSAVANLKFIYLQHSDYQEAGIPQGGIVSSNLFVLKINSFTHCLPHNLESF